MEAIHTADFPNLDPGFAAYADNFGPLLSVDYYTTSPNPSAALTFLATIGLGGVVTVHSVPFSEAALATAATAISDAAPALGLRADLNTNPIRGSIALSVLNLPNDQMQRAVSKLTQVPLVWNVVTGLAIPSVGGGKTLSNGCTGGFVVENVSTGQRGLSTAGHCPDGNVVYDDTQSLTPQASRFKAIWDYRWYTNNSLSWGANAYMGVAGGRPVNSREAYNNIGLRDPICKYGKTTGYTCGSVDSKGFCPAYVPSCTPRFILADHDTGYPLMVKQGDSGGPAMYNNTAIGIVSGCTSDSSGTCNGRGIFMNQDDFDTAASGGLNIRVLVTP